MGRGRARGVSLSVITVLFTLLMITKQALPQSERRIGPPPLGGETERLFAFDADFSKFPSELKEGFSYLLRGLFYGNLQEPSDSPLNPDNYLFQTPTYGLTLGLRPDFSLNFRSLYLSFKPRLYFDWQRWEKGPRKGESDTESDVFINEWLTRLSITDDLFVSYGRENVQWGPSVMVSPSNPFFAENGQANPKREIAGMDFARLVWIQSPALAASIIANTSEGQQDFIAGFEPVYALKVDYTSFKKYGSLVLSRREGEDPRAGAFAGATVSDAILVYGEASLFKGDNLYHLKKDFEKKIPGLSNLPDPDCSLETLLLLGGSYTFEAGPTLSLEYAYNSAGFSDKDVDLFYRAVGLVSGALEIEGLLSGFTNPSDFISGRSLAPNFKFLRRNYVMVQYSQTQIANLLDLALRYTYEIDGSSSRITVIAACNVGDRVQLFMVGNQGLGPKEGEYRIAADASIMVGIEYTF